MAANGLKRRFCWARRPVTRELAAAAGQAKQCPYLPALFIAPTLADSGRSGQLLSLVSLHANRQREATVAGLRGKSKGRER
jgi:hypothetical protein